MKICQQQRAAHYRLHMKSYFLIVEDWSGPDQIVPLANTEVTKSKNNGHLLYNWCLLYSPEQTAF